MFKLVTVSPTRMPVLWGQGPPLTSCLPLGHPRAPNLHDTQEVLSKYWWDDSQIFLWLGNYWEHYHLCFKEWARKKKKPMVKRGGGGLGFTHTQPGPQCLLGLGGQCCSQPVTLYPCGTVQKVSLSYSQKSRGRGDLFVEGEQI